MAENFILQPLPNFKLATKPFVKWVGGKSQLLEQFEDLYPSQYNNYIEPMVGGGAVFFCLFNKNRVKKKMFLMDVNLELINCYEVIKEKIENLIPKLKELEAGYKEAPEKTYYQVREWDRQRDFMKRPRVERAARAIFLNKTCYNGLYRVNSKGQFNTPIGSYKNPTICDGENLHAVSMALQKVELLVNDFEKTLEIASRKDFIYFDPPYHPLSETANFTNYTEQNFTKKDQKRLEQVFRKLDRKGCKIMLSNSDTEFIRKLYKDFSIHTVYARRHINSNSEGRGTISEVVVTNY